MYKYTDLQSIQMASFTTIYACYRACRRRKRRTVNALLFEVDLEQHIVQLSHDLLAGTYTPRPALAFMLYKPKQREIFAADFRDRIVHHVLVAELEPVWEKRFIYDSYACRKAKGNLAAAKRLQVFTRQATANNIKPAYYLQLDIASYFTAINRDILYARLCTTTKHPLLQELMHKIIYQNITQDCRIKGSRRADFMALPARKTLFKAPPHKGLPIGNLTSQFFGNVYLDALDQFIKHELKARWYVRYCDDFVLLSHSKQQLAGWLQSIAMFLNTELELTLRSDHKLALISSGIDFLGYIIRPTHLIVRRRVAHSLDTLLFTHQQSLVQAGYRHDTAGNWALPYDTQLVAKLVASLNAYHGHLLHAASHRLQSRLWQRYRWLVHYVVQSDSGVFSPRYPAWNPAQTLGRQIDMARYRFPDCVVLVQIGNWWLVLAPVDSSHGVRQRRMIHAAQVDNFARSRQLRGQSVACIAQTDQRITSIYDRQLSVLYLLDAKLAALAVLPASIVPGTQLRLL